MTEPDALRRENGIVLDAVQALLGLISSDVVAVAVLVEPHRVELSFWVHRHTAEIEDDMDQAVFDMDALSSGQGPTSSRAAGQFWKRRRRLSSSHAAAEATVRPS